MMEQVLVILPVLGLIVCFYFIRKALINNKKYLIDLGAQNIKFLIPHGIRAELRYKDATAIIYTSGVKGSYRLNISLKTEIYGFLRLWRPDFLDRLIAKKTKNGYAIECEDFNWASRIISHLNIEDLFKKTDINCIQIDKRNLVFSWLLKRNIREVKKESSFNAIEELYELSLKINNIPSSSVNRENLRSFFSIKMPLFITALLTLTGVFGRFWLYKPQCILEIVFLGIKLYAVLFIVYVITIILIAGNLTFLPRIMFNTFVVFIISCGFVTLFFLTFLNGALDASEPVLVRDKVSFKYRNIKKGEVIILENLNKRKKYCGELTVSKNFYENVKVGDTIEYEIKKGRLGVEWIYSSLKLVKKSGLSNED